MFQGRKLKFDFSTFDFFVLPIDNNNEKKISKTHSSESNLIFLCAFFSSQHFWSSGCCHSTVDSSAPSICHPGFESQAHHLCFLQFILELCHVEKTKINKEEDRINPFKKQNIFDLSDLVLSLSLSLSLSLTLSLSHYLSIYLLLSPS